MAKKNEIIVKDVSIKTMTIDDYICITDIARWIEATNAVGLVSKSGRDVGRGATRMKGL
jgi:hypothetical protein